MNLEQIPDAPPPPTAKADAPDLAYRAAVKAFGESNFKALQSSRRRNGYFHRYLAKIVAQQIPPGSRVLDVGCASGDMLANLQPALKDGQAVGIDINAP